MFVILDVVIGVVFVYLLLALLVAAINEWIISLVKLRARNLQKAISRLLEPPPPDADEPPRRVGARLTPPARHVVGVRTLDFYRHPRIVALTSGESAAPSYMPAATFAEVVLDLEQRAGPTDRERDRDTGAPVDHTNEELPPADPGGRKAELETLFKDTMDRATGWFKRTTQIITAVVGAFVVVLGNADTLQMANTLWLSPTLRAEVVAAANERARGPRPAEAVIDASYLTADPMPSDDDEVSAEEQVEPLPSVVTSAERELLDRLIGWTGDYRALNRQHCRELQASRDATCSDALKQSECQRILDDIAADERCALDGAVLTATTAFPGWESFGSSTFMWLSIGHLFGWLLTIAAISLGAPFWFDTLKNLINIRGAGKKTDNDEAKGKK
ncbi:MAG: hypothetical protein ACRD26_10580 [Vicinamibacterales bacterium]